MHGGRQRPPKPERFRSDPASRASAFRVPGASCLQQGRDVVPTGNPRTRTLDDQEARSIHSFGGHRPAGLAGARARARRHHAALGTRPAARRGDPPARGGRPESQPDRGRPGQRRRLRARRRRTGLFPFRHPVRGAAGRRRQRRGAPALRPPDPRALPRLRGRGALAHRARAARIHRAARPADLHRRGRGAGHGGARAVRWRGRHGWHGRCGRRRARDRQWRIHRGRGPDPVEHRHAREAGRRFHAADDGRDPARQSRCIHQRQHEPAALGRGAAHARGQRPGGAVPDRGTPRGGAADVPARCRQRAGGDAGGARSAARRGGWRAGAGGRGLSRARG